MHPNINDKKFGYSLQESRNTCFIQCIFVHGVLYLSFIDIFLSSSMAVDSTNLQTKQKTAESFVVVFTICYLVLLLIALDY